MKLQRMEVVIDQDALSVDISQVISKLENIIKEYAYILHNKDLGKPHYHIYLNFYPNFVQDADVANWFNLGQWQSPNGIEQERYIYKVRVSSQDLLLYYLRFGQYQPSDLVTNIDLSFTLKNARKK